MTPIVSNPGGGGSAEPAEGGREKPPGNKPGADPTRVRTELLSHEIVVESLGGDTLEIEESSDGTHITGNWVGKFAADGSVSGERMNADDSNPVPFDLKPVGSGSSAAPAAGTVAPKTPQPAAPSLEPAPPPAPPVPGNALGGTSNVIIGE